MLFGKNISVRIEYLIPFFLCAIVCTACAKDEGILLIDEMSQVDFDIDYPVGQITKDVIVTQSFVSNADRIGEIWLYGATYMRSNTATINVSLLRDITDIDITDIGSPENKVNSDGKPEYGIIYSWTIDSSKMTDNSIIKLEVEGENPFNHGLKGKECVIEITSPDGEPELSPTFWMTEEDEYPDGNLSINGYAQYNDLWFQVVGYD